MTRLIAQSLYRANHWDHATDSVVLNYEDRFLRRKSLTTSHGQTVLVDLPQTTSLDHGDALALADGRLIEVIAAQEDLLEVTGDGLHRLAWHIGNRHTPCQIEETRLLIQPDKVIADMLRQLGADTRTVHEAFTPEGGAYGHGRTHGHDHSASHMDHTHTHDHAR